MDLTLLLNYDSEPATSSSLSVSEHHHPLLHSSPHAIGNTITKTPSPEPATKSSPSPPPPPTHSSSHSSSSSDEDGCDERVARRRLLRLVGQKHRDKQRQEIDGLFHDISHLEVLNQQLSSRLINQDHHHHHRSRPAPQELQVSHKLSEITGVNHLPGGNALVILEYLANRRNLYHNHNINEFTYNLPFLQSNSYTVDLDLPSLRRIHSHWSRHESQLPQLPSPARPVFLTGANMNMNMIVPRRICIARDNTEDHPTTMVVCRPVGAI